MYSIAMTLARRLVAILAFCAPLSMPALAADTQPAATPQFHEILASPAQLKALEQGGFTVYMRHSKTDNSKPDRVPAVDLNDCTTQRQLSEEGRQLAARVGRFIRTAGLHFDEIHISPMCRVKDTATAAFPGEKFNVDMNLIYVANFTAEQKAPILARTRTLLSTPVAPHHNRLIIAHAPNMMDLIGYFPKEATLVIFRPLGESGFEYVASIPPDHWSSLLKQ